MSRLFTVPVNCVLALAIAACSAKSPTAPAVDAPPARASLVLIGKYGAAHACPVGGRVVTAAHVAYRPMALGGVLVSVPMFYAVEDAAGRVGTARPSTESVYLDLAVMETTLEGLHYYARGTAAVGDAVTWVEYDFRSAKKAYQPRERKATITTIRAHHIALDDGPTPGASGGCLFNAAGEVVGILSWFQWAGDGSLMGAAVALTPTSGEL